MALYKYRARDKGRHVLEGIVEAVTEDMATETLKDKGLFIISLKEQAGPDFLTQLLEFMNKITPRDLVFLSRQLSVMVSANVPIVQALRILIKQTSKVSLQTIISDVADDVDGGAKLSEACAKYPKVFNNFFVNVVKAGETSGKLAEVLNYLADEQEKDYDLMSKIKGAMIYPIFIIGGMVVVGALMMTKVIPQLTSVLQESNAELPFTTKLLISTSNFMVNYWYLGIIGIVGLIILIRYLIGTKIGRKSWDVAKLKVPIFGKLFQKIYVVRFTRSLGTLLKGGVIITNALKISSEVVGNYVYYEILNKTIKEVEDGNSISTVFLQSKAVPVMIPYMLSVGEETGQIDEVLEKVGNFYSREIDNMVRNLVTLLEPLIMVVLGVAVAFMVSSILLPMWQLAGSM